MEDQTARRIRVLFIIDFIHDLAGGTENQLLKLIENLNRERYELHLLALMNTPWVSSNRARLNCRVKALRYNVFNHKDPINIKIFIDTVRHVRHVCPDIVVCFFKISYMLGVLAARMAGVTNIISTRRDYGLWYDNESMYILRFANRYVKGIVTNSHEVRLLTSEKELFDASRIHVIYNGLDPSQFSSGANGVRGEIKRKLGLAHENKTVGIVGSLTPMKRHRTFIKAAKRVLASRNDVDFVLVGDGKLRSELERLADDLGIIERVRFAGIQEDVTRFLCLFDIGVNTSANEGLSNAIMEYMAQGIPCIVSDAGGNPELIEDGYNGYVFPLDDERELADRILTLLGDPEQQRQFAARSKEIIMRKFSLDGMIAEYDRYFSQLLV